MANTVPLSSISAPVIQLNNTAYLTDGQYDPRTINGVPCGDNALVSAIQHWAVPIKDYGIVTNFFFEPAVGNYPPGTPPTPDSLLVLRVRDKFHQHWTYWVIATMAQYYASCQTCCDDEPIPIPTPVLPVIVPCQTICEDADGVFQVVFGYPADAGEYVAIGQFNGVNLTTQNSSTIAGLVVKLNLFWTNIGSPSTTFVWTASGGVLKAVGGVDGDSLCVLIISVASSP